MRYKYVTFALLFILFYGYSNAQKSDRNIKPISFDYNSKKYPLTESNKINTKIQPEVNVDSLIRDEEKKEMEGKSGPYCFGYHIGRNYNLKNSGAWDTLENGGRLWRHRIVCPGAYSVNIACKKFKLPKGGLFFMYNEEKTMVLGAFSKRNNRKNGRFYSDLLKGATAILEYYEPSDVIGDGVIELSSIVHGYKNVFAYEKSAMKESKKDEILSDSLYTDCGFNVNCSYGDDWCREKRAVAKVYINEEGTGYKCHCTGSLINNARNDSTPYFLTAFHCLDISPKNWILSESEKAAVQDWMFLFEWYRENCYENSAEDLYWYSIDGSDFIAALDTTDCALLKLQDSTELVNDHNPYFAGWTKVDSAPDTSACLHHPVCSPMKISIEHDTAIEDRCPSRSYYGWNYWRVSFDIGGTSSGTSGSPLYNMDHQVQGQASRMVGTCTAETDTSWFGKFSYSYGKDGERNDDEKLKPWLDPDDSGISSLEGLAHPIHLYGVIHDPLDERSEDDSIYNIDQHKVFFNIGPIKTGGGVVGDDIYPFKVKYYPNPPYDSIGSPGTGAPGKVTLVSRERIVLRSCTQILHGSKFHAYIGCTNDTTIAVNTGNEYSDQCQPPGPKIPFIQKSLFNNKDELKSQISAIIPNPFSNATTINYVIAEQSSAKILVSNIYNQVLRVLLNDPCHSKGEYAITLDSKDLPSGVYYVTLITPNHSETKLMMIIK